MQPQIFDLVGTYRFGLNWNFWVRHLGSVSTAPKAMQAIFFNLKQQKCYQGGNQTAQHKGGFQFTAAYSKAHKEMNWLALDFTV